MLKYSLWIWIDDVTARNGLELEQEEKSILPFFFTCVIVHLGHHFFPTTRMTWRHFPLTEYPKPNPNRNPEFYYILILSSPSRITKRTMTPCYFGSWKQVKAFHVLGNRINGVFTKVITRSTPLEWENQPSYSGIFDDDEEPGKMASWKDWAFWSKVEIKSVQVFGYSNRPIVDIYGGKHKSLGNLTNGCPKFKPLLVLSLKQHPPTSKTKFWPDSEMAAKLS